MIPLDVDAVLRKTFEYIPSESVSDVSGVSTTTRSRNEVRLLSIVPETPANTPRCCKCFTPGKGSPHTAIETPATPAHPLGCFTYGGPQAIVMPRTIDTETPATPATPSREYRSRMRYTYERFRILLELWEERCSIIEFCGGLSREDAEWEAFLCVRGERQL